MVSCTAIWRALHCMAWHCCASFASTMTPARRLCRPEGASEVMASCATGLLVWSIALVERQRDIAAAAVFAVLLNMKHLFAAAAPAYFVYLLRHGCRWVPQPSCWNVNCCFECVLIVQVSAHPGQRRTCPPEIYAMPRKQKDHFTAETGAGRRSASSASWRRWC